MPGIYGGDDVSAIVLDAGSSTFRAGWAGEDTPRSVIPTSYAWLPDDDTAAADAAAAESSSAMQGVESSDKPSIAAAADGNKKRDWKAEKDGRRRQRFVGDFAANVWRPNLEIDNPLEDGIPTSIASYLALCEHSLAQIGASASEHPLLLTEPAWNTKEAREDLTELAFEALETPAFFLANSTVLSSFASGKPTSLLLDVGSSHISAIPVVDGFILRKGIQRQPGLGGDAVSRALLHDFKNPPKGTPRAGGAVNVRPLYEIKSKAAVNAGAPSVAVLHEDRIKKTTASFRDYHVQRLMHDAKEALAQVYENPWEENGAMARPARSFELPDGYNDAFGIERFRAPEVMFSPGLWNGSQGVLPTFTRPAQTLPQMVLDAIAATDVDSRPALLSNIVCVGGGTCIPGFNDRLSWELSTLAPGQKIKIHSPGNQVERRYSSWLGGSILASLGTFHQLWISKQEYDEHGPNIVHARCR